MKRSKPKKEPNLNIFHIYILVIVFMDLLFYPLFPLLLNYPPGSINSQFDIEFSKIPYYQQYIIINLLIIIFGYICFKFIFKDIGNWNYILKIRELNDISAIKKVREKSFTLPIRVCVLQIVVPIIFVGILFVVLGFHNSSDVKFFMILSTFLSLVSVISYLFSKKYFRKVLKYTYIDDFEERRFRISLPIKTSIQILPLFLLSVLFLALVGQSSLVKEKGNVLFKSYQQKLKMILEKVSYIEKEDQIKGFFNIVVLNNENDITFYISPTGGYRTSDNSKLSEFFLKYTRELAFKYNGHTYDYYGSDVQGIATKIRGTNGEWIFGIKYVVSSPETTILFTLSITVLFLFAVLLLSYFGKSIADDIILIASGLKEIAAGDEIDLNKKIAVTSNDEIGDLVMAFNKVQEREKKYIQDINNQQKIIIEQERLASLGQLISGITHNLKTPIMSLSMAIKSLKDLVIEYRTSISDQRVTDEDHCEIAIEMESWLSEMEPYCEYMADVLATIKGQVEHGKTHISSFFTIGELLRRVEIITNYELSKSGCVLEYDNRVNPDLEISGEISNLVQVLENLISNSIQAYKGKKGLIKLVVISNGTALEFQVKDLGHGIPENIKAKLFKEIITTKGNKGTGLGLYISSAIIKGKFGGEISFEQTVEKGTTFYIYFPLK